MLFLGPVYFFSNYYFLMLISIGYAETPIVILRPTKPFLRGTDDATRAMNEIKNKNKYFSFRAI